VLQSDQEKCTKEGRALKYPIDHLTPIIQGQRQRYKMINMDNITLILLPTFMCTAKSAYWQKNTTEHSCRLRRRIM